MAQAEINGLYPNVVEVDAERGATLIRCLRVGDRHDRVLVTVDPNFIAITLQREGDAITAPGRPVLAVPLPWPEG